MLLRLFGARVGRAVHIYPSVRITIPWNLAIDDHSAVGDRALLYSLGPITIGERVTISHQAQLCAGTHDYRKADFPLLKPPIVIEGGAWICADAFVGPGVTIGANAIVAARAVATKDVASGMIVGGNPARSIKPR
jgi:putative colanic acid biosynthesis acetyltransferase WcaF